MILCSPWMFNLCNTFTIIFFLPRCCYLCWAAEMMTISLYFLPKWSRQFAENCGDGACKKKESTASWRKEIADHEDFLFHSIQALTQLSSLLLLIIKTDISIFLHFVIFIPFMGKVKSDYWVIKPTRFFELNFLVFLFLIIP